MRKNSHDRILKEKPKKQHTNTVPKSNSRILKEKPKKQHTNTVPKSNSLNYIYY